jgi:hypothetical protein
VQQRGDGRVLPVVRVAGAAGGYALVVDDYGPPIAYIVLADGTPVYSSDGQQLGKVKRVLADTEEDIFDGLIVDTPDGDRFVDAPHVDQIYERGVVLSLSAADARNMPEPTPSPAVMEPTPDDIAGDTTEDTIGFALRRAWDRISGKY